MATKKIPATETGHSETAAGRPPIKLLSKAEMLARVGVSYVGLELDHRRHIPAGSCTEHRQARKDYVRSRERDRRLVASRPVRMPKSSKQNAA